MRLCGQYAAGSRLLCGVRILHCTARCDAVRLGLVCGIYEWRIPRSPPQNDNEQRACGREVVRHSRSGDRSIIGTRIIIVNHPGARVAIPSAAAAVAVALLQHFGIILVVDKLSVSALAQRQHVCVSVCVMIDNM